MSSSQDRASGGIDMNDRLAKVTRFASYEAGDMIISVEDPSDNVYFIMNGSVKITNHSLNGKEVWHGTLSAGRTFGELAALTGERRNATIIALEPTRLAVLTKSELFSLMRQDVEIAFWMLEDLARRLTQSTETVSKLVSQNLPQRIRGELMRLAREQPAQNGRLVIRPLPNLTDIARRLNTDRENVSREVSALVKREAISKSKLGIELLNVDYLENSQ